MIDSYSKLNALCTSLAHAVNRLGSHYACDIQAPPDLRDLITRFIKSGGQCQDLYQLFEEADRPTPAPRKSVRWEAASSLVSPVVVRAQSYAGR